MLEMSSSYHWKQFACCLAFLLIVPSIGYNQELRPTSPVPTGMRGDNQLNSELGLAASLTDGTRRSPNYARALEIFKALVASGSFEAKAWLGSMYLLGHGTPCNPALGLPLIEDAAEEHNPVGLRFLAVAYAQGLGVPRDLSKARSLYQNAIDAGDIRSYSRLGMMMILGLGAEPDHEEGKALLVKGASKGDPWAMVELGHLYATDSPKPNLAAALLQYEKAATYGNRIAAFRAGRLLEHGAGAPMNIEGAASYYLQAARQGQADAQVALGNLYSSGAGVPLDQEKALALYSLASDLGNLLGEEKYRALSSKLTPDQRASALPLKAMFTVVKAQ